jgi:hypothetical protein
VKLIVDVPDNAAARRWMKAYKDGGSACGSWNFG